MLKPLQSKQRLRRYSDFKRHLRKRRLRLRKPLQELKRKESKPKRPRLSV